MLKSVSREPPKGLKPMGLQLCSVYSHSPIPTLITGEDGKIVVCSDSMAELTGYLPETVPDLESWINKLFPDKAHRIAGGSGCRPKRG